MDKTLFNSLIGRYVSGECSTELISDINSAITDIRVRFRRSLSRRMSKEENAQVKKLVTVKRMIRNANKAIKKAS